MNRPSPLRVAGAAAAATLFATLALGAEFRYAEDQAPAIVNPLFSTSMSEARVAELVFESLYTDDKDLRAVPQLAEGASLSDDRLSMTLRVKPGVKWHDGKPLTANDVVFTIQAMKNAENLSTEAGRVAFIKEASADADGLITLSFHKPEAAPEEKLFFKILPAHRFESTTVKRTDAFRTSPIGTGPYKLRKFNSDNSISLDAFSGHRKPATISDVVMREVSDKNYQAKLLLYESLEALVRVLPRDLAVLQNNKGVALYPYQTNSWWYLGFNMQRAPFDDVRVRQAMAHLLDRAALLAPVGTGDLLSGPFVKSSPFYNHEVADWQPDDDKASALLREAGWTLGSSGWINQAGERLKVRVTAHKALETSQEVVINLQSQLKSAGVDCEVTFLDDATWKGTIWQARNFDIILSQWSFDRNEDVREQLYSTGSRNFVGYSNPEADLLLDQARTATDPQARKAALRKLHARVHEDAPMIFLWTLDSYSAFTTKARGVVVHPFYFFSWISDWKLQ